VKAADLDRELNGHVTYYLQQFTENKFSLDVSSGQLSVTGNLDRELTERFILCVTASDKGHPPLSSSMNITVIVTDVNDNSPAFTHSTYNITVDENMPRGADLLQVTATDPDKSINGQIRYSVASEDFHIDSVTGLISVAGNLDREKTPLCSFTVIASDHGSNPRSGTATVHREKRASYALIIQAKDNGSKSKTGTAVVIISVLDINDNAPRFPQIFLAHVPENAPVGFIIVRMTITDEDIGVNAISTYSILDQTTKLPFAIDQNTGDLTVAKLLDRETTDQYIIRVHANDSTGSLNVLVQVEDVNDNPPRFCNTIFFATVAENSPCGTEVLKLNATDVDTGLNAEINFSIDDGHTDMFAVDQQSGIITVQEILDFEMLQFYEITVRAFNLHDTDHFSLAKVYINVTGENEYLPQFSKAHYNFAISEIAPKGTIVGYVTATDRDLGCDGIVNYLLVANSKKRGFKIDGNTGVIVVSDNTKLCGGSFTLLHVLAKNAGIIYGFDVDEALINITLLDVNNPPVFKSSIYQTHIREDVLVGTSVITLMAEDSDTVPEWNQLLIEIEDGNTNQSFSINPNSGVVLVASPLDRETLPVYNITIIAFDSGQTPATGSTQLVIIVDDVNDNGPILVTTKGYVTENQPPGREILALNATDLDLPPNQGPFTYQLAHEDSRSFFTLSPMGVLTTKKLIDREHITELYLPVMVQDSGTPPMSSMGTVHILVLDQNDNPSQPRNLYIQVNYYGKYYPGGKLGMLAFLNIYI
uniref:Cadherin domain-containing protein n=1 Tax=Callorhinchus milii TaxID=7868 RepID=A0A4W3HSD4_CALMI